MPMTSGEIAFANSMRQIDEIQRIEQRLDAQDVKIKELISAVQKMLDVVAEISEEVKRLTELAPTD